MLKLFLWSFVRFEDAFAQADGEGRDFDQFVVGDELERSFE